MRFFPKYIRIIKTIDNLKNRENQPSGLILARKLNVQSSPLVYNNLESCEKATDPTFPLCTYFYESVSKYLTLIIFVYPYLSPIPRNIPSSEIEVDVTAAFEIFKTLEGLVDFSDIFHTIRYEGPVD